MIKTIDGEETISPNELGRRIAYDAGMSAEIRCGLTVGPNVEAIHAAGVRHDRECPVTDREWKLAFKSYVRSIKRIKRLLRLESVYGVD